MLSAKDAFEAAKGRSQKVKEEKLKFVETKINEAIDRELLSVSFSFVSLKPFVGIIVEKFTELGYIVEQTATGLSISWDLTPKSVKKAFAKPAEETVDNSTANSEDYYDDDDEHDGDELL